MLEPTAQSYQNAALGNNDVVTVVMTSSLSCSVPATATSNVANDGL